MENRTIAFFSRLMVSFGLVMIILSLVLLPRHPSRSAERIVSVMNIIVGSLLVLCGKFLSRMGRKDKDL
ncbi:MAG: hypothetical protein AB7S52_11225 [Sphaerochaetaceae bacterium]